MSLRAYSAHRSATGTEKGHLYRITCDTHFSNCLKQKAELLLSVILWGPAALWLVADVNLKYEESADVIYKTGQQRLVFGKF